MNNRAWNILRIIACIWSGWSLFSCTANNFDNDLVELPEEIEISCRLLDSIPFEHYIDSLSPEFIKFKHPMDSIDSLIPSAEMDSVKIGTSGFSPSFFGWFKEGKGLKYESDNSHLYNGISDPDHRKTHEFYVINDCSWIYRFSRIDARSGRLVDRSFLTFNDSICMNCIRYFDSQNKRVYLNSKPNHLPYIDTKGVYDFFLHHQSVFQDSNFHE